jgi:hypothetical protein
MRFTTLVRAIGALTCLVIGACSVTRPVPIVPDAPGISAFLSEHPQTNLRVTEHSGRKYWVHTPTVRADSLVGQLGYDVPSRRLAVHLDQIAELGTTHFSWGRTGALAGGTIAAAVVALGILVEEGQPID